MTREHEGGSPIIELPKNEQLVAKLKMKLDEYKARLEQLRTTNNYLSPRDTKFIGAEYKIAILEKLLEKGSVDTFSLSRELNEKFGGLEVDRFNSACSVIESYCTGSKEGISGGTGLNQ